MQHWSWILAAVESALQAQAQNLMHWTAFGFGLGIAAYFGVPREPGPLVFLAASLSAGLCVGLAIQFRTGIARLLIVIAALGVGLPGVNIGPMRSLALFCQSGFMVRCRGGLSALIAACLKSRA